MSSDLPWHRKLRARFQTKHLLSILLASVLLTAFSFSNIAKDINDGLAAFKMEVFKRDPSGNVTVIAIDTASINAAEAWPWPRERFAQALSNLNAAGAGMIAFDVDFSARSTPEGDAALKAAIDENPGWIVLPTFIQRDVAHKNSPFGEIGENAVLGSVNIELSQDGRARTYRRGFVHHGEYYPSLGGWLAGAEPGDTRSFQIDYGIDIDKIDTISFDDVLNNRFDRALVQDHNILIGATAIELGDLVTTPHQAAIPGVYIHAAGYESLLQNRAITSPSPLVPVLAGILALLAGTWIALTQKLLWTTAIQAFVAAGAIAVSFCLYSVFAVNLNIAATLFASVWNTGYAIRQLYIRKERELVEQKSAYLKYMARHDGETGLPNREAFLEDVGRMVRQENLENLYLVAIGIDRFREIRGAFGYANANALVRSLSNALKEQGVRNTVYRLDRSVVATWVDVASGTFDKAALKRFEKNSTYLMSVAGQPLNITIRAGVSVLSEGESGIEVALEQAVLALDQARKHKKAVARWFGSDTENPTLKLAMLHDIRSGLEKDEFHIVYQPKYSVRDSKFTDLEALIRWNHNRFGAISPADFITTAEETGAIDMLTLWIARRVLEDQAYMRACGVNARVAINVSGRSISDEAFCTEMIDLLQERAADITVEITETAVIDRPDLAIQGIAKLRNHGIRLSIDDYGSGQSSLNYLKTLDAQELKLDRSMILNVAESQRDRLILKSTFDLAHALNMEVVCEGVEDATTFAALAALGCDKIQGFFLARPMPIEDAVDLFREQQAKQEKVRISG